MDLAEVGVGVRAVFLRLWDGDEIELAPDERVFTNLGARPASHLRDDVGYDDLRWIEVSGTVLYSDSGFPPIDEPWAAEAAADAEYISRTRLAWSFVRGVTCVYDQEVP